MKKLGLKIQNPILILNAPQEYGPVIQETKADVHQEIKDAYDFIQFFVTKLEEAHQIAKPVIDVLNEDGHLWCCYPKGI